MISGKGGQRWEEEERRGQGQHVGHTGHKSTRCMSACPSGCRGDSPLMSSHTMGVSQAPWVQYPIVQTVSMARTTIHSFTSILSCNV